MIQIKLMTGIKQRGPRAPRVSSGQTIQARNEANLKRKKEMYDFAEAILDNTAAWDTLENAKADVLSCLDTLTPSTNLKRIRMIIESIDNLDELIKYCYNLRLRVEGLSIHSIIRRTA